MIDLPSPNHGPRPVGTAVDILLVHYTGMPSAEAALRRLCDPAAQVSAHYAVDEDGTIYRLVPEERRAWHAGVGGWRGDRDVNSRSIGVELVNPGHEFGYRPFPAAQTAAFAALAQAIMERHGIRPEGVLGHADIACARKEDPGELFDWPGLARLGVGLWPEPAPEDDGAATMAEVEDLLDRFGYDTTDGLGPVIVAFQRHFRPDCFDGVIDDETVRRLRALVRWIGR